jgi:hypothetical protein
VTGNRMRSVVFRILAFGLIACVVSPGQIHFASGQDVVPVYEGWERNPDGSFNMVFGYFNRNYEEEVDVPVGPDNKIEPGAPDQGQPAHFYPRRQEFVFKVRVPADWGEKDLVWTLNIRGKAEKRPLELWSPCTSWQTWCIWKTARALAR